MSLFNTILQAVLGGSGNQQNQIAQVAMQLLSGLGSGGGQGGTGSGGGGLAGLIEQFQKAGLGDAINSWISTGENQPVNGAQIQQALGSERIQQFAQQMGVQGGEVSDMLSKVLPQIIDRVTPNGSVPQQGDLQGMLSSILGGLGGPR